ncbi:helix-turn-helix transcriptional regulator [Croceibacter atlanticus]|jgi:putative transcriptional regulator|uniref:Repressor protein n=1 Tax=Croceibacter atlanticus (strain ATCC BAA-628 / JCM 21780 / CIP 108009 / IAM 15332 / KCTC 12090 / HTCC2559) TaxID=216432 RepID=A3UAP1_CROAH|nr:helix-turn-helix transcriptional regulator [Croceibacter atlanticus]EAP86877.1 repressor protein [Croceibacter atlanticus HTCC2559]WSP34442.1 helix-turn-helix transcriptional regulator [Croceibacter atlanticus]|tara:strand:- start:178126 stop:178329 length:204 start_codon:yes stop_codon:yes gene_type:complete
MKNNVKEVRKTKKVTQVDLAEYLSVSRQTIISIESGRYVPSTVLSLKIAKCFETTVESLFVLEASDF